MLVLLALLFFKAFLSNICITEFSSWLLHDKGQQTKTFLFRGESSFESESLSRSSWLGGGGSSSDIDSDDDVYSAVINLSRSRFLCSEIDVDFVKTANLRGFVFGKDK